MYGNTTRQIQRGNGWTTTMTTVSERGREREKERERERERAKNISERKEEQNPVLHSKKVNWMGFHVYALANRVISYVS